MGLRQISVFHENVIIRNTYLKCENRTQRKSYTGSSRLIIGNCHSLVFVLVSNKVDKCRCDKQ